LQPSSNEQGGNNDESDDDSSDDEAQEEQESKKWVRNWNKEFQFILSQVHYTHTSKCPSCESLFAVAYVERI
jgi:hypothetical protein